MHTVWEWWDQFLINPRKERFYENCLSLVASVILIHSTHCGTNREALSKYYLMATSLRSFNFWGITGRQRIEKQYFSLYHSLRTSGFLSEGIWVSPPHNSSVCSTHMYFPHMWAILSLCWELIDFLFSKYGTALFLVSHGLPYACIIYLHSWRNERGDRIHMWPTTFYLRSKIRWWGSLFKE